jgi:amidase
MSIRTEHAFCQDVLADHDATALAELIRSGELSPVEVTEAAIARAEKIEPSLSAIVVDDFDRARQAAQKPRSGAFSGVPTFIKDMTDVAGLPTRFGSEAFSRSAPVKQTHRIAQQMIDMGMVLIGKSTMPDFGFTPSTEFPDGSATRNPWNLDHSVGGSSGGAAALVAAGVVPIANAADGGGSIRIPAACCGLVGLKPSRGRMPTAQAADPFVGIVTDGVVTRSVRDTASFLAEVERLDPNPKLPPIGKVDRPLERKLRIGAVYEVPVDTEVDDATAREFQSTVDLLTSLGHHVEPIKLPVDDQFVEDFITYWSLLAFLVKHTSRFHIERSFDKSRLSDLMLGFAKQSHRRFHKLPGAIRRLRKSHLIYSELFQQFDVLSCPVVSHLTPKIGYLGMDLPFDVLFPRIEKWCCFTPYANATGGPSLSLPLGFDEPTNLPVGMLFGADVGNERLLLELAFQLEQAAPWRTVSQSQISQQH